MWLLLAACPYPTHRAAYGIAFVLTSGAMTYARLKEDSEVQLGLTLDWSASYSTWTYSQQQSWYGMVWYGSANMSQCWLYGLIIEHLIHVMMHSYRRYQSVSYSSISQLALVVLPQSIHGFPPNNATFTAARYRYRNLNKLDNRTYSVFLGNGYLAGSPLFYGAYSSESISVWYGLVWCSMMGWYAIYGIFIEYISQIDTMHRLPVIPSTISLLRYYRVSFWSSLCLSSRSFDGMFK